MKKLVAPLFALPFALVLAGCPIYGDGDGHGGPTRCVGDACLCSASSPCASGYCDLPSGRCLPGECGADSDCAAGERCDLASHTCVARPAACRTHGDCAVGSYCAAGACAPSGTCTSDASCSGGFVCDFRGTCVPPAPPACRTTADCAGDTVCVEGQCRPRTDVCQFNNQCGAGRACVNNACVDICTGDADCGSGASCQSGFCRPNPSECTTSADCTGGEHCVEGRCLADCTGGAACTGTHDACAADLFCRPDWRPRLFCTSDAGCAPGHVCRMGVCRSPCPTGTNDECRRFDSQVPICASDMLCYTTSETMPECAVQTDCVAGRSCIDAICR